MDAALYDAIKRDAEANERTVSQTIRHKLRELVAESTKPDVTE
jgi:hypothetical protein